MKTKQSVYIVNMKDGTHFKIESRAQLTEFIGATSHTKIDRIYRAVPMAFQTQTVTRLVATRPDHEGAKGGGKDDPKKAT